MLNVWPPALPGAPRGPLLVRKPSRMDGQATGGDAPWSITPPTISRLGGPAESREPTSTTSTLPASPTRVSSLRLDLFGPVPGRPLQSLDRRRPPCPHLAL